MQLSWSHFTSQEGNPTEMRLFGRLPVEAATSLLEFKDGNSCQRVLHSMKYHDNAQLAKVMGAVLGEELARSHRFDDVDLLVPVPLHPRRERQRGYNQSFMLCRGIARTFPRPISEGDLVRTVYTQTQTRKGHTDRATSMEDAFLVRYPQNLQGRHLLVVDDVLTSGATIEAACRPLMSLPNIRLSIATLAIAGAE